ncbi:hypothetical protein [Caballeronia insecticola]|uniref:hypothetical protein n=1 Tax=Caballeronia insecticola TaxID=758793 RepID=UPI001E5D8EF9|nr:hypothetical protein [Caballeronia insecticola]
MPELISLLMLLIDVVLPAISFVFCVVRASMFVIASPMLVTVVPSTLYVGAVIEPSGFTVEPPPIAAAVD